MGADYFESYVIYPDMLAVPWNKNSIPECSYKPEMDVAVVSASLKTPEMWTTSSQDQAVIKWVEKRDRQWKGRRKRCPLKIQDWSPVWHVQTLVTQVYCWRVWSVQDCFLSSVAGNRTPGSACWSMDCMGAVPFVSHEEILASVPNEHRLLPRKLNGPWTEGKSIYHLQGSEEPPVSFTKRSRVLDSDQRDYLSLG